MTLMPCPDKKLEASRRDFLEKAEAEEDMEGEEGGGAKDVDCVLTSTEVLDRYETDGEAGDPIRETFAAKAGKVRFSQPFAVF